MRKVLWLSVLATAGLFTQGLSASVVSSNFKFANCSGGSVTVTNTTITWLPAGPGALSTYGCINTGFGTNVSWSGGGSMVAGATGYIADEPVNAANPFMIFPASGGNPTQTLNFLLPTGFSNPIPASGFVGTGAAACQSLTNAGTQSGESCLVSASSPFLLTLNAQGNTTVTLLASGTVADPNAPAQISNYNLQFSTQLTGNPGTVYSAICPTAACAGSDGSTFSAQGTITIVPEPGTIGMMLIGAGLVSFAARKRTKKA